MTMHEQWMDKLSDYVDGELSAEDRYAVESHLQGCAECMAILNDLKRVVARAQAIGARPPQADLWAGIAGRIDRASADGNDNGWRLARRNAVSAKAAAPRRFAFTLPQLAAAAALIAAVSGGLAWSVAERARAAVEARPGADLQASDAPGPDLGRRSAPGDDARIETVGLADAAYDAAVADLEKALNEGRGRLDASTIAVVEHNLQTIDQAIQQAREALAADPANSYLSSHLVETRRRKLDLLRRATALASETN